MRLTLALLLTLARSIAVSLTTPTFARALRWVSRDSTNSVPKALLNRVGHADHNHGVASKLVITRSYG
jgi:hypothetical protein